MQAVLWAWQRLRLGLGAGQWQGRGLLQEKRRRGLDSERCILGVDLILVVVVMASGREGRILGSDLIVAVFLGASMHRYCHGWSLGRVVPMVAS